LRDPVSDPAGIILITATILQNVFLPSIRESKMAPTILVIGATGNTGKSAVAMINPEDVGNVGAHLLALEDTTPHNHARYVLSGPEDVTGERLIKLVEQYAGVKVQKVEFKATSWIRDLVKSGVFPEGVVPSILAGCEPLWQGKCSLAGTPTGKEIMELAPPTHTIADSLKTMLEE
jgi:uncharacterized protein YbjT (DUF2867 family)